LEILSLTEEQTIFFDTNLHMSQNLRSL
jgi:hypothetical protein